MLTRPLYESLRDAARRAPDQVVVVDAERILSYDELLEAIDIRAAALLNCCNPGDRVGVLIGCSAESVITYYACLRAGLVYAPIFAAPPAVLTNLIRRLGLAVLVADEAIDTTIPILDRQHETAGTTVFPDADPALPAHLLLTSGSSSGNPKAVVTDQIGSALSHAWRATLCPFAVSDVVGCNIFGIWDVVPALERGVPVVMIRDAVLRDPLALAGVIVRHAITRMMLTPSLLAASLSSPTAVAALRRLRLLVLCGEPAKPATLQRAERELTDTRLLDLYSISECHDVAAGFVRDGSCRLRPAPFADIRVVATGDGSMPADKTGRILVGGPGVALGYLDGDSRAFFEQDGARWYDTGDLGVLHEGGELTVTGRSDARVKIRGRWVDPAEVETALAGYPDVVDVLVTARDDRLLAQVAGHGDDLAGRLQRYAAETLPRHAVPDRIEQVARLDLAPSGKASSREIATPEGDLEAAVLTAFREILNDPMVGPDDAFADLGGTSLDAVALCGRLEEATGRPLSVAELLSDARPRKIAATLARLTNKPTKDWRLPASVPAIRPSRPAAGHLRHPLVTGASGFLGQTVRKALGAGAVELRRPGMDLDRPLLGLSPDAFANLATRIDGIVHVAARVDPFAPFDALYATNTQGTVELIRLAGLHGLPVHHVSSSAVLPLGSRRVWTPDVVPSAELAEALRASGADAYSYTKLGAEIALWRAAENGLPVRIVRVPHVIGNPRGDRLLDTLAALRAAGVYPEGDWQWQFVTRELVVRDLLAEPAASPASIRHVALPPVTLAGLVNHLNLDLRPVPMAAIVTALGRVDPRHPHARAARVLRQLVSEHGPASALSANDAILNTDGGDALGTFKNAFTKFMAESEDRSD